MSLYDNTQNDKLIEYGSQTHLTTVPDMILPIETKLLRYRVYCNDNPFELSYAAEAEIKDDESLMDAIDWTCVNDEFQDLVDEAIDQFDIGTRGTFDVWSLLEQIVEAGKEFIRSKTSSIIVKVDELDEQDNVLNTFKISLSAILQDQVELRCQDEGGACVAGRFVEHSLFKFVERGQWQFALVRNGEYLVDPSEWPVPIIHNNCCVWKFGENEFEPEMWFGVPNQAPLDIWKAKAASEKNESIWFEEDEWSILAKIIGDYDDYFMTWYFPECGNSVPDIDEIKNTCPVSWDANDSDESLKSKISSYMIEIMKHTIAFEE